ncbi:MAG: hypothetical protein ABEK01_00550 [Candidatus Nanohaloarchaea archaeon]
MKGEEVKLSSVHTALEGDSRELIKDALEYSEDELAEVEAGAGFSFSDTYDRIEIVEEGITRGDEQTVDGTAIATVYPDEGETVLLCTGGIPDASLAHESVHGRMYDENGEFDLPDEDEVNRSMYTEFVAYLAEHRVNPEKGPVEPAKDKPFGEGLKEMTRMFENMSKGGVKAGSVGEGEVERTDPDVDRMREVWNVIEASTASLAAVVYHEENDDYDMEELIDPDRETYAEVLEFVYDLSERVMEEGVPEKYEEHVTYA